MRDVIIDEIRRIASENGGQAPGKTQFLHETGITESDWYGKIWARWSDAVSEAGLIPNEMNSRLDSSYILERYAEACRHYGKPPTIAELKIYARNTPGFPGHNTFSNHFGGKAALVAALRKDAIEKGDGDLISVLPLPNPIENEGTSASRLNIASDGFVYLLKSGSHYKIGRSEDIEKRIKQIAVSLPEKVELIHFIRTDDPSGIEGYWHRRFADQRENGEWFRLSTRDVKAFKKRKYQ